MQGTAAKLYSGVKEFHNWPKYVRCFENWPTYVRDWLGLVTKGEIVTYRLRDGLRLRARAGTADRVVISNMLVKNAFALDKKELGRASVVVDIGAHIGAFSAYAASLAKGGRVYAYEPEKDSFDLLVQNITVNRLEARVIPVNSAVSGSRGTARLFIGSETFGHSTEVSVSTECTTVPCTSLGDIFKDNKIEECDLLKINAEGAEYSILFGADKDILSRVGQLYMHCHNVDERRNVSAMQGFLLDNGFSVLRKGDCIKAVTRLER